MSASTAPPLADSPGAILADALRGGLTLDLRGESIVARPRVALTPALQERIIAHREALIGRLGQWITVECRSRVKEIIRSLHEGQDDLLDAIVEAWKRHIDAGRAAGEPVADYERAALEAARRAVNERPQR